MRMIIPLLPSTIITREKCLSLLTLRCVYVIYLLLENQKKTTNRLPSPEEKAKAAASQVFPAEVVRLDVTGSGFERMTQFRRSLQHFEYVDASAGGGHANEAQRAAKSRKRSKKKSTKKRRNTIACDGDRHDIQHALRVNTSTLSRFS